MDRQYAERRQAMRKLFDEKRTHRLFLMSEYGKNKLLGYADSFREIARTLEEEYDWSKEESRQSRLYNRRLWENRCMLADNLNEMATVMAQVAGEVFSYKLFSERKARQITQILKGEGLQVTDMYYIEKRDRRTRINMTLWSDKPGGFDTNEAADLLSILLDERLVPSVNCAAVIDNTLRNYTFVEEPGFVMLTGAARAVKETEAKSGDNYAVIEAERGRVSLILSDGMGSGQKANEDSEVVLDLMEKLMEAGYAPVSAANLVNNALLLGGEEQNMSTLDICEVDLYDGICEFTKIGGAASFIKRGHMVEQICAGSLPLGIFKSVEGEGIRRRLMDGDYVFLVTDGVLDAVENCDYEEDMCGILGGLTQENPKELAETLLQIVLRKTRGRIRDDMTILVFGLWENT